MSFLCSRSNDDLSLSLPSRKDLSKSFAQLSLPGCLELSSKVVEANGIKITSDTVENDDNDVDDDSSTSIPTSSVLVVVAKTIVKAYTQFGPLQV